MEPTGADSASHNGSTEQWNQLLVTTVRALLFGASLEAKYLPSTLIHVVYLHNQRIHRVAKRTLYEGWHGARSVGRVRAASDGWGADEAGEVIVGLATIA